MPGITIDTLAPTITGVALTPTVTGAVGGYLNIGDVVHATVTFGENVVVTGSPTLNLTIGSTSYAAAYNSATSNATNLVFDYTIQANQTDTNGISVALNSLSLNSGTIKDAADNAATLTHIAVGDNASYMVDTTAPVFSSGTTASVSDLGSGIATTVTVYNAVASDTGGSGGITYTLGGTDASLFNISSTGAVTFRQAETFTATKDTGQNHIYDFTVSATDVAQNTSTNTVALTMKSGYTTGQTLYSDAACTAIVGKLIAKSGSNYYWDFNGDGSANDFMTHDFLDVIFKYQSDFVTLNPSGAGADTTATYRYGLLYTGLGNAVKVALLDLNELTSIALTGVPAGWNGGNYYWAASQGASDEHASVDLSNVYISYTADYHSLCVAVQVL